MDLWDCHSDKEIGFLLGQSPYCVSAFAAFGAIIHFFHDSSAFVTSHYHDFGLSGVSRLVGRRGLVALETEL